MTGTIPRGMPSTQADHASMATQSIGIAARVRRALQLLGQQYRAQCEQQVGPGRLAPGDQGLLAKRTISDDGNASVRGQRKKTSLRPPFEPLPANRPQMLLSTRQIAHLPASDQTAPAPHNDRDSAI